MHKILLMVLNHRGDPSAEENSMSLAMPSHKLLFTALAAFVLVLPAVASAQNPHFISASDATDNVGDLVVSWKEAGLGNNVLVNYTTAADGTAVYACINNGGNHPQASNKETVSGPVTASGAFNSGKNGQITASLTAEEPGPGSFTCPNGQSFVLASVSYTNVTLSDDTNGISESLPDTGMIFCDINNLTKATVKNCAPVD
jgi:hypothetical protein